MSPRVRPCGGPPRRAHAGRSAHRDPTCAARTERSHHGAAPRDRVRFSRSTYQGTPTHQGDIMIIVANPKSHTFRSPATSCHVPARSGVSARAGRWATPMAARHGDLAPGASTRAPADHRGCAQPGDGGRDDVGGAEGSGGERAAWGIPAGYAGRPAGPGPGPLARVAPVRGLGAGAGSRRRATLRVVAPNVGYRLLGRLLRV